MHQVWIIDPRRRTVEVFTSEQECSEFGESDTLEGGEVLPGFSLQLAEFFAELDETARS